MLHTITPASDRADALASEIRAQAGVAREALGDGLVGYALITWDALGSSRCVYNAENGPVAFGLVPTFVHDTLNRAVAVTVAQSVRAEDPAGA